MTLEIQYRMALQNYCSSLSSNSSRHWGPFRKIYESYRSRHHRLIATSEVVEMLHVRDSRAIVTLDGALTT